MPLVLPQRDSFCGMSPRSTMILFIFFMTVHFCTAQIHPEQRTMPTVSDEQGVSHFGDPLVHNGTTQEQFPADYPHLMDELSSSVDLNQKVEIEPSPSHLSQPLVITTLLTDQNIGPSSVEKNVEEKRNKNMACTASCVSDYGQLATSVPDNSNRSSAQFGNFSLFFVNLIDQKPSQSKVRPKQCPTPSNRQRHRQIHGEKRFQCDMCAKQFRTAKECKRHRRIHTGEKPYHCDICPKKFCTSGNYHKHRRTHTGEKPFQCDICPKQFRDSGDYKTHRRIHTGEKPFQCHFCHKNFSKASHCSEHRRTHTGEKPFQCELCPKQFITSSNYRVHRRMHTGKKPFQCSICSKQFSTSGNYQRHKRIHTEKTHSNVTGDRNNSVAPAIARGSRISAVIPM